MGINGKIWRSCLDQLCTLICQKWVRRIWFQNLIYRPLSRDHTNVLSSKLNVRETIIKDICICCNHANRQGLSYELPYFWHSQRYTRSWHSQSLGYRWILAKMVAFKWSCQMVLWRPRISMPKYFIANKWVKSRGR